jgi:hypothetical protein
MENDTRREAIRLLRDSIRQATADVAGVTETLNGCWPINYAGRREFRAIMEHRRAVDKLEGRA